VHGLASAFHYLGFEAQGKAIFSRASEVENAAPKNVLKNLANILLKAAKTFQHQRIKDTTVSLLDVLTWTVSPRVLRIKLSSTLNHNECPRLRTLVIVGCWVFDSTKLDACFLDDKYVHDYLPHTDEHELYDGYVIRPQGGRAWKKKLFDVVPESEHHMFQGYPDDQNPLLNDV
jgi:hypothetical protein